MKFGIFELLNLIGALGFFIFGMKVMSDGIQKAGGAKMRQILGGMTSNRYFGVMTGFLITAIVQSSSATTVMTVSFVNAGLLTLVESAGVMMGANIGTTITAWIISILGFKVNMSAIALPIIAFGVPMMFARKTKTKNWGEFLVGFALLFIGLYELKDAVPDVKNNPEILNFLAGFADISFLSRLMFVGVGTLLTIVVQSSSAAMALTLVLCSTGVIPFEVAAAMVLGENIGTTITAELASLVGNVHAKRSARIHTMFNIIGVTWMLILMPYALDIVEYISMNYFGSISPYTAVDGWGDSMSPVPIALSIFHTGFNLLNVLLLIWFIPRLVKVAERTVKSQGDMDEEFHLEHIGTGLMQTAELSILKANKEVEKFGKVTAILFDMIPQLLQETDSKKFTKLLIRIRKYEDITDRMEVEIADYLAKAAQGEMSDSASRKVRSMLSIINDMERIGDICYQLSISLERKSEKKAYFIPELRTRLEEMITEVQNAIGIMNKNLCSNYSQISITDAKEAEQMINKMRNELRKEYLKKIETGEFKIQTGLIYNNLIHSLEKVGDHIYNISEAIEESK
ncbi:MAG: Na/Pi cotransporter [Cryomorphaceae bacterium BACL11 MAG-121001-bin54]|jgi:phosphate:Na+ symporter|nr:MAG: Na/Pi cotransporter [Cryomorphaceae bacterium BACL11 MAG-121001-bin54]KRO68486.1 MAG: Na/Pi cotransporter [Cryomorphaceae bacterium BACL11 MAG-121128-bin16]